MFVFNMVLISILHECPVFIYVLSNFFNTPGTRVAITFNYFQTYYGMYLRSFAIIFTAKKCTA